jgi:hypothetical protein
MPKNSNSQETHNDEIDLLELFRRSGKIISKWLLAIGNCILVCIFFLFKNLIPLILSIIAGIGLSYVVKWSTKPFYISEITFRSNTVPNSEMISYINKLNWFLKEKNYSQIASVISTSIEKAEAIRDIEAFWIIDKNNDSIPDFVDYRNKHNVYDTINVRMKERFVIRVKASDAKDLTLIRNGIILYVNNNLIYQKENDFRLRKNDELLARFNYDIKQLDSLQKVKYFEETRNIQPEKGGQMIFLQDLKTQLVYDDIYSLYQRKQLLDKEKDLYPDILTLISDFYPPAKRYNGGFYYGKVIIPLCFGLMFFYLIFQKNRKKLREIYRRY